MGRLDSIQVSVTLSAEEWSAVVAALAIVGRHDPKYLALLKKVSPQVTRELGPQSKAVQRG